MHFYASCDCLIPIIDFNWPFSQLPSQSHICWLCNLLLWIEIYRIILHKIDNYRNCWKSAITRGDAHGSWNGNPWVQMKYTRIKYNMVQCPPPWSPSKHEFRRNYIIRGHVSWTPGCTYKNQIVSMIRWRITLYMFILMHAYVIVCVYVIASHYLASIYIHTAICHNVAVSLNVKYKLFTGN